MITLGIALSRLDTLGAETEPETYTRVVCEDMEVLIDGVLAEYTLLTVHYVGSGPDALPLEAHLLFGRPELGAPVESSPLCMSFVYCPLRYINSLEEGLTVDQAEVECRRRVEGLADVLAYLTGKPYHLAT